MNSSRIVPREFARGLASRTVLATLLLVFLGLGLARSSRWANLFASPASKPPDTRAAIQFLKREELAFLVTERVTTQVVIEKHEGNALLGKKDGFLVGTVELLYGLDLTKLDDAAFDTRGDTLCVTVPPPRLLRSVIDETSLRFVQKRSPLFVLVDNIRSDNLFQRSLDEVGAAARHFAETNDLIPTREALISRLTGYAPAIQAQTGVEVVFE